MARTQAADYDAKREAITEHAATLFAEKGFAGASISELAVLCQVSKSLIYHYYASKEDILFDVMDEHINELLTVVETESKKAASPKGNFHNLTRALLLQYVGAANRQKVLLYETSSLPPDRREQIVRKQRKIIRLVEDMLCDIAPEAAQDRNAFRARVMLYFGMLNWTHTWFKPKGAISRDQLAHMAADIILGATSKPGN